MTLFGNKVFVDDTVKTRSSGWTLIQYGLCSYEKKKFGHRDKHTQGELCVNMRVEIGMMILQAKEPQRLSTNQKKLEERHGTDSP